MTRDFIEMQPLRLETQSTPQRAAECSPQPCTCRSGPSHPCGKDHPSSMPTKEERDPRAGK